MIDINDTNFVQAVEEFGLTYPDFSNRNYNKVVAEIRIKFKEYFDELGDFT